MQLQCRAQYENHCSYKAPCTVHSVHLHFVSCRLYSMRWNPFQLDALCKLFQKRRDFCPLVGQEDSVYSPFLVVRLYLILRFLNQLKKNVDTPSF